ncbi:autotransporter outer membrane beta-barrel domain-containing protein [Succinispira mobilis]|uniref:autotransporter outer membrane beta-barrel domain-containing protein n=1 Tax=Succinispira mobilis TaxID=78120 RepID=UPI00036A5F48|nr:autotransporter outer membrane beta-barrel domain-containing protein [Succinispira mobilis]
MKANNFLKKMQTKQLLKQIAWVSCASGCLLFSSYSDNLASAATITTTGGDYDIASLGTHVNSNYRYLADDININNASLKIYNYNESKRLDLLGNIKISNPGGDYALFLEGVSANSSNINYLLIDTNKTVQIDGNIKAQGALSDDEYHLEAKASISLSLNNSRSYLAGDLILTGDDGKSGIGLTLKNGGTWYPKKNSYTLSTANFPWTMIPQGIHLNVQEGGVIDLYHENPTTKRASAVGRTFTLTNTGTAANNATFVLQSDLASNSADKVVLNGTTGSNTYYVQIANDPVIAQGAGTYTATGEIVVMQAGATDTVNAKAYTTTQDYNAGLTTNTVKITPTLATTGVATKLTGLTVESIAAEIAGPAQQMANAAAVSSQGVLSAWRAENNDLLRRMGDLRQEENETGIWARIYGGDTEINTSTPSKVQYRGMQVGYDSKLDLADGKLFKGIAISHMQGDVVYNAGKAETKSTMFGVYGSYQGKKGHFADLIVKYGRMSNEAATGSTVTTRYESSSATRGLNLSLEYGYHKELDNNWYVEPLTEINYGRINSNDYTMQTSSGAGAQVKNEAVSSVIGRLGINIGKQTSKGNVYGKLAVVREFAGGTGVTTNYGSYSQYTNEDMKDTWFEYGVGFNHKLSKNGNLYGEITKTAGADKVVEKWKANVGYRHSF